MAHDDLGSGDYGEDIDIDTDTNTDVYEDKDVGKSSDECQISELAWRSFELDAARLLELEPEPEPRAGRIELVGRSVSFSLYHLATKPRSPLNSDMNFDINIESYIKEAQEAILSPAQLLGGSAIKTLRHYQHPIREEPRWPEILFDPTIMTEVSDQGQCSCCCAFVATDACTSHFAAKSKSSPIRLSTQNMVDHLPIAKSYVGNKHPADPRGCYYSTLGHSFEFIRDFGVCSESDYPYEGKRRDEPRSVNDKMKFYINDFSCLDPNDNEAIKKILMEQPIAAGIKLYQSFKTHEGEGIYIPSLGDTSLKVKHAVLIVGYGEKDGVEYYLIKNSWGLKWGMDGFARVSRDLFSNLCYPSDGYKAKSKKSNDIPGPSSGR